MTAALTLFAVVGGGLVFLVALAFATPLILALWHRWACWCDTVEKPTAADEIKTMRADLRLADAEVERLRNELAERGGLR